MYQTLDQLILAAVWQGIAHPLYSRSVKEEAKKIAGAERKPFRVIDSRIQALRKAGKLEYKNRTWSVVK